MSAPGRAPGQFATPSGSPSPSLRTPSQTAGPFVSLGTAWLSGAATVSEGDPSAIVVSGCVEDGDGRPVTDAMLEFWQNGATAGSPVGDARSWSGLSRAFCGPDGHYRLVTMKPAALPGLAGRLEAPHIDVSIFARGLLQRLVTRIYFSDEEANGADPVLAGLESPDLRRRLVAQRSGAADAGPGNGTPTYFFDIHLQGDRETVFFGP
jgi:protocatechuate 3,4-dioxygenase, alpha subunit